ncbi:nitroreductase family deazaflavin-dependent oxidoreductase [Nocardia sp. XZ_19_385]|uniref:nitroreductase family deazaflavin-dependent oxidoreductase n=1 Tax=Nocardia sp. XZ_19_385 TaxID=2769488 RepID=UPI00188E2E23|nr:nitroreductase family deazaflavin-dependent oxidoreductase [Nocardia sp. XZ_19_385]
MVLPRALARFNRHVTNPAASLLAGRVPPFGTIVHKGRKSGRAYRTPVTVFESEGEYRVALTYGPKVDWVKNLTAAGAFQLEWKGSTLELIEPEVVHDPSASWAPIVVRQLLIGLNAEYYLRARPAF